MVKVAIELNSIDACKASKKSQKSNHLIRNCFTL